jgi:putative inorganic carbon (HCO3(-)) transporter
MVEYLFSALFFLIPLIFYPKTSEVFEFNKMIGIYIFTTLIVAAWITKMIRTKKIIFSRTILDIPLLLFLGSQIISTIISIDQRTSLLGYYSRFNGGLFSTICYCLLYWAFISNFSQKSCRNLIRIILTSATLVAIYGILEHFGHSFSCVIVRGQFNDDCWVQNVQARVFATLGQPNWLSAFLTSLVPLTWYYTLTQKQNKTKIIYLIVSVIFFLCILFTGSRAGFLGLAAAGFIFFGVKIFKKSKKLFLVFLCISLLIGGIFASKYLKNEGTGTIRIIVWQGAIDVWKAHPILGTGVETFGYSYWQFRPIAHNNTSEWNFLYNKAHNEYLNFAANTGTIGLISYSILIGTSIFVLKKNPALFAGYISILITNFFGFSVVVISLFTFLFPAMAITLNTKKQKNLPESEINNNQQILIGGVILVTGFFIFIISRYWYADLLYSRAQNEVNAAKYEESIRDLQGAITISPNEAIYHNEMARIFMAINLPSYGIIESDIAFNLSPRNINIRETRISIYLELGATDPRYIKSAIDLLNETITLSPTDPKLPLLLGKTYENMGKLDLAIDEFKKALTLKPDYIDAKKDMEVVSGIIGHDIKSR